MRIAQIPKERASRGTVYPMLRLAAGAVLQAVNDLGSPDVVVSVDALCWWLSDDCGLWLDAVGYPLEPGLALRAALDGRRYAKKAHNKHKLERALA